MTCTACGHPLHRRTQDATPETRRHAGHGLCPRCYDRAYRKGRRNKPAAAKPASVTFTPPPDAPCIDDPMLWDGEYYSAIVAAMRGCKECPVLTECAMSARSLHLETGVAGGRPWGESIEKYRRGERLAAQERREEKAARAGAR